MLSVIKKIDAWISCNKQFIQRLEKSLFVLWMFVFTVCIIHDAIKYGSMDIIVNWFLVLVGILIFVVIDVSLRLWWWLFKKTDSLWNK